MSIDQLKNKGVYMLNQESGQAGSRQIIVLGSARGGTSIISGALHHLGVFTGKQSCAPVYEDVYLSNALEENRVNDAKQIIKEYNAEHDLWAWKRPAALDYLDKVEQIFDNPFYIIIFKDIFSIANRNNISMKFDITSGLKSALAKYAQIVDFISNSDKPMLLVSAEKALHNKEDLINAIIAMNSDLIDLSPRKNEALEFITPDPKGYLDATRITKAIGQVGKFTRQEIRGWAVAAHDRNISIDVELYYDDLLVSTVKASEFRKGPLDGGHHNTGDCGFSFKLENLDARKYKAVSVIAKGEVRPLKNGRKIIDALLLGK